jgi:hypothetical protein
MNSPDVTVVGLAPYTVILEDIRMDVPPQQTVTIPGDLASTSKDLERTISQRLVFRLNNPVNARPTVNLELERFKIQVAQLEAENKRLQAEIQRLESLLRERPSAVDPRLEEILSLLRSRPEGSLEFVPTGAPQRTAPVTSGVVEVEVPQYIPERISPEVVGGRVNIQKETTDAPGVDEAKGALRKLRGQ